MKRVTMALMLVVLAALPISAATALYQAGESKWFVTQGKTAVASAVVKSDGAKVRVDWAPTSGQATSFVAANGKIFVKGAKGDTDFASFKGATERAIVPALLLPTTTAAGDKVVSDKKAISSYTYGANSAKYTFDAKGPSSITVTSGKTVWTLTRSSFTAGAPANTAFEVKQKESRFKSLTKQAGNLASGLGGGDDSSVGASAGVSGVGEGTKLDEVGDYDALAELETRDEEAKETREADLKKFQKEGKVGKAGGAQ